MVALPISEPFESASARSSRSAESRWSDLRVARSLLPDEVVSGCCLSVAAGAKSIEVCRRVSDDGSVTAFYKGLHTCKSVWLCPICSARISERRAIELHETVKRAESMGLQPLLVTLTFSHTAFDKLADLLPAFAKALQRARSGRDWQQVRQRFAPVGCVRALEVTHGKNGWHPHAHELWFLPAGCDVEAFTAAYRRQWERSLDHAGLTGNEHAFKADAAHATVAAYVAKYGREPRWGPGRELTKSAHKLGRLAHRTPWQLLSDARLGDDQARRLFLEYAGVFKGRRQLQWSPGLRAALALPEPVSDADACGTEVAPYEVACALTPVQWSRLVRHEVEHAPLVILMHGGSGADVLAYVEGLGPPAGAGGYLPGELLAGWRNRVGTSARSAGALVARVELAAELAALQLVWEGGAA